MLTPYENEILSLIAAGKPESEIARRFDRTEDEVRADIDAAIRTLTGTDARDPTEMPRDGVPPAA